MHIFTILTAYLVPHIKGAFWIFLVFLEGVGQNYNKYEPGAMKIVTHNSECKGHLWSNFDCDGCKVFLSAA